MLKTFNSFNNAKIILVANIPDQKMKLDFA